MAPDHAEDLGDDEEAFIDQTEVYAEIEDNGDHPMDEEDEEDQYRVEGENETGEEVVYEDNSIRHFSGHEKSVFAICAHPTAPIAASGGEDELGYIWDVTTGEQIVKLTGHTDSVTAMMFSNDGEMIATGGMDGRVRVWRRVGKNGWNTWEFLTELQGPDEIMWLQWHPKGTVLLAGSEDTTLWMWQLPSGDTMQVFAGHTGPVQCGEFTPDGKRIVTADAQGMFIYWDPRSPTPIFKLTSEDARFGMSSITAIGVNFASTIAVVGGSEGDLRVVSLSKGEIIGALASHKENESVEAILFVDLTGTGNGTDVVITAGTDGKAFIWDLTTMRLRATMEHQDAIIGLMAHKAPKSYLVVTTSADSTLCTWDARTGTLVRKHTGHRGPVLGAALSLDDSVVVSAGDDGLCSVFPIE